MAWAVLLVCAAIPTAVALVLHGYRIDHPWMVIGLAIVAAVAQRQGVAVTERLQVSVALLPHLIAAAGRACRT